MPKMKVLANPAAQKAKEARLARRRELRAETRELAKAALPSEEIDSTEALIRLEAERQGKAANLAVAARKSPKLVAAARENLSAAFDWMGGVPALVVWGRENRTEFYRIWARLIPKESVEASASLPLEALLEKLAGKAELSVGEAAFEIGNEVMEDARRKVAEEDAGLYADYDPDRLN